MTDEHVTYRGFFPSEPFWAVAPAEGSARFDDIVFRGVVGDSRWHVTRDGLILLHLPEVERQFRARPALEDAYRLLGTYLEHLNCLFLLIDSACVAHDERGFLIHEIAARDVIRAIHQGEGPPGILVWPSNGRSAHRMEARSTEVGRFVVPEGVLVDVQAALISVFPSPELRSALVSLQKAVAEINSGGFRMAIVSAWFACEATLASFWERHIRHLSAERRKRLSQNAFTPFVLTEALELLGVLDEGLLERLTALRKLRNSIAHQEEGAVTSISDAIAAAQAARDLIRARYGFEVTVRAPQGISY